MKLYVGPSSGNSYKVQILIALLNIPCEIVVLDMGKNEHKSETFRKINPRGQLPTLVDGDLILWDSSACLLYLGRKFGGEQWAPSKLEDAAVVAEWLALAGNEIQMGLQYARRGVQRGRWIVGNLEQLSAIGRLGLEVLESRLAHHPWLYFDRPTIADLANFPYVDTAPEVGIDLAADYPGVHAWIARCKALPKWPTRDIAQWKATPFKV
jgi:glutathione S-transferase